MKRNSNFIMRDIVDEHILLPRGEAAISFDATMIINDVGASIWNMLADECSVGDIVQKLIMEYDIDEQTARDDTCEFIDMLKEEGLLDLRSL